MDLEEVWVNLPVHASNSTTREYLFATTGTGYARNLRLLIQFVAENTDAEDLRSLKAAR